MLFDNLIETTSVVSSESLERFNPALSIRRFDSFFYVV